MLQVRRYLPPKTVRLIGVRLMNPPIPMPEINPPKKLGRIIFAVSYNLINVVGLILCVHLTTIIRSKGPSGFGELIIKSLILLLSFASFYLGIVLSVKQYRAAKLRFVYFFICFLITILLAFFAVLGVIEACSDSKGYCRNWRIVAVVPNIEFNSDALKRAG